MFISSFKREFYDLLLHYCDKIHEHKKRKKKTANKITTLSTLSLIHNGIIKIM